MELGLKHSRDHLAAVALGLRNPRLGGSGHWLCHAGPVLALVDFELQVSETQEAARSKRLA